MYLQNSDSLLNDSTDIYNEKISSYISHLYVRAIQCKINGSSCSTQVLLMLAFKMVLQRYVVYK